jgi:hypothetical protein
VSLFAEWLAAKAAENEAVAKRRDLEDRICGKFDVPSNLDGTIKLSDGWHEARVVGRINRKVDGDKLQELAAEAGLSKHLPALFRWKPEINAAAWKSASKEITAPLLDAITSTPGRPSFTIITKE